MSKSDVGKGDTVRPRQIPKEEWDANYDRIFGSKKKQDTTQQRAIESETK